MTAVLELAGVERSYTLANGERLDVLRSVDLRVEAGSVVAITGRSGSGKSTMLNVLGLLEWPTAGRYTLNGVETTPLNDDRRASLRGSSIGFVFQQFHLMDRRTALENVAEPLLFGSRAERATRRDRARELLESVGLGERAEATPNLLSGGEQQRVAIARALARRPQVILADEPTGALDESTGAKVLDLLLELVRDHAVALVLVTHDRQVSHRADHHYELSEGKLTGMSA